MSDLNVLHAIQYNQAKCKAPRLNALLPKIYVDKFFVLALVIIVFLNKRLQIARFTSLRGSFVNYNLTPQSPKWLLYR